MSNYTAMDPNAQPVYVAAPGAQQQPVYVVAGAQPPAYQQQVVYAAPGQYPPQQQYQQQPPQGYQQQQGYQPQQYAPPQDGSQPQQQLPPGTQYQGGNGQTVVVVASQQKVSEAQTILLGGLCGCFDDFGSCCLACLCPICLHGMNAQRVNAGNCVVCSVAYWFAWCCVGGYVRGQYFQLAGLPDPGFCVNCCTHCCCVCCALSQEARATTKLAEGGVMMRN